jgi:serine/threonine protein kinase
MPPRSPSLVAGLRIGGYELVRRIGRGGMAEVWCAKRVSERRTSKYVAIKVVADQFIGDPRFQRMFRAEAEISSLLNQANIVQVFDEGEDDGRSYLVMEWVDGVNLLKVAAALTFIDDEPWKHKISAYIVGQLLYALGYAHGITLHDGNPLGVVHRDVSPQNVLVSNQGEVKLTDFGIAHHVLEESSGLHVKGKVRYMAPEQLSGHTRDPRLDLYAVGAILHELLDGRRFRHHVEDQREMYIEVLSGKVPRLSRSVPPELDALRLALLEPDPNKRVPSADAALALLERFSGYGDARRDLIQLCAGLTGVLRPRVGPGTSQGLVMAASATAPADASPSGDPPAAVPSPSSSPPPAAATPPSRPSTAQGEPTPAAAPSDAASESERHRSRTLRMVPTVPGAPESVRNDTSPLPPAAPRPHAAGSVRGEVDDVVGGSGALIGAGAERGGPYDVPPDTSVMTPSMVGRIASSGPIGLQGEDTDSQHELSTITSLPPAAPASSPGSTMIAPRQRARGTSVAVLIFFFALGSLGMTTAFVVWGDAIEAALVEPSEGRPQDEEKPKLELGPPPPDGKVAPEPPKPEPPRLTSDGSTDGTSDDDGGSTSGTDAEGGSAEDDGSITDTNEPPPTENGDPRPKDEASKPRRPPTVYSGLIVAVDGTEPLIVRVGSGKPATIESRKSKAFRVPVGKGRKVQWKRKADAAWSEQRVDIRAKCELQLRVPSRKTMTLGSCG